MTRHPLNASKRTPDLTPASLPPLRNVLAVAAGGAIGALLRYSFVLAFPADPGRFPLVTFSENLFGSFALGLVLSALLGRWARFAAWRPFLCTGVLGSFTTFSAFSLELYQLSIGGWGRVAFAYGALSVGGGLLGALSGFLTARRWFGGAA